MRSRLWRCIGSTVNDERFLEDTADGVAGVERFEGILKDHLQIAAYGTQPLAVDPQQIFPLEPDPAGCGFIQSQDAAAHSGFAATGFSHQPEGPTLVHIQGDVVHGVDIAYPAAQYTTANGKVHLQMFHAQYCLGLIFHKAVHSFSGRPLQSCIQKTARPMIGANHEGRRHGIMTDIHHMGTAILKPAAGRHLGQCGHHSLDDG